MRYVEIIITPFFEPRIIRAIMPVACIFYSAVEMLAIIREDIRGREISAPAKPPILVSANRVLGPPELQVFRDIGSQKPY